MNSLAKNSIFNALYKVLDLIFPLISSIYVARILMPDGVGRIAYAQNIASYFITAAALGIPVLGVREISVARGNQEKLNKTFSELVILNAVFTSVALLIYCLLVFFNREFRIDYPLYIAAGLVVAFNYINIDWMYKGYEEYPYIVIRSTVMKVLSILAMFLFVKGKEDYISYAFITSLATCGNYVFNVIQVRKFVRLQFRGIDLKRHLKPIFILAVSLFFSSIYSKIDVTMLGSMVGEESVGYYSYAHKILNIAVGLCTGITAAFLPRLSFYYQHNIEEFHKLVSKGIQVAAFLAFPAAVGMFLLAPEAVELLFGYEFLPAAKTLRYFSAMVLIFTFGNLLCYQMMICSGKEKTIAIILGAAAVLNVVLNRLLIPMMQHDGAALASVCTELFINGIEIVYTSKLLKLRYDWKVFGQAVFSSAVMGGCILLLKQWIGGGILPFACCVVFGIVCYVFVNIAIRNQFIKEILSVIYRKRYSIFFRANKERNES